MVEEQEFELAVIDRVKYQLQPHHMHLQVPKHKWFSQISEQERAAHLRKMAEMQVTMTPLQSVNCDVQCTAPLQSLSVDMHATGLSIPQGILEGIWKKASELLSLPGAIGFTPGLPPQAQTVIKRSGSGFHTVIPGKAGQFSCDDCINYMSLSIC